QKPEHKPKTHGLGHHHELATDYAQGRCHGEEAGAAQVINHIPETKARVAIDSQKSQHRQNKISQDRNRG
ncbi:MAG TPA: hypothetical protein VIN35_01480, partial [Hydrogenophaga sp.]